jgi:hypothetical protein
LGGEGTRSFQPAMTKQDRVAIEATRKTPSVLLEHGKICIKGRAISENPGEFFRPLYDWIIAYINNSCPRTEIEFGFEYINTSSIKWIFAILREVAGIKNLYGTIKVIWIYEKGDDDMRDLGMIFRSMLECPFSIGQVDRIINPDQAGQTELPFNLFPKTTK